MSINTLSLKSKASKLSLYLFALSNLFLAQKLFGQNTKLYISGTVKDANNGETIIGATVRLKELPSAGNITNEYGFYSISAPKGNYTLVVSYLGYVSTETDIELNASLKKDIVLKPKNKELKEVKVTEKKKNENITTAQMGVEKLDMKEISKISVLLGERDIIKTLQLMPGVKGAGEGNAGYYVRGGGADQNLILLDEAPVYNASHLLGFFSTFNSDAIKNATLYKGSQPANYGGRLASVLDIKMNEGNSKHFSTSGGIGLISSKLNFEGPIKKDKGSFLITGRRTYADLFLKLSNDKSISENQLYFYDLNAKANYKIGEKDRIYLSGYFGKDKLGFGETFGISWGNSTGTLRWNHIINNKLFSNTSLIFSNFNYEIKISAGQNDFKIKSHITDYNLKQEFQYFPNNKNKIKFGFNTIHHTITAGRIEAEEGSSLSSQPENPKYSWENALYFTNDWQVNSRLNVEYGLRLTSFSLLGGSTYYDYDDKGEVINSITYSSGEILKTYLNPEPRLSASYSYTSDASIKASISRNVQNVHQLSNATASNPTDIWIPTSFNVKSEIGDQLAIGWFKNFNNGNYEFSAEAYYKEMQNQVDYKNGANSQAGDKVEGELVYGKGRAYGLELLLKKKTGRLTGWVGYTLSRTERKFDGINNNEWYLAKQDRTHDISIVGIYELKPKWSLSAAWIFYTGNAVTFPSGKYNIDGTLQWAYTERNSYRMPNYHRLDLGLTYVRKKTEKMESSWNFSLYNAYGRENAYTISFREAKSDPNKTEVVQTTLFRWIPSVTYNFKF